MVDEHRALAHAGEGAIGAERDFAQVVVVADAAHHEVLARAAAFGVAAVLPPNSVTHFSRLGGGAVIDRDLVAAFVLEMPGHGVAHDAQAQKRYLRHRFSPSNCGHCRAVKASLSSAIGHCRGGCVNL